MSQIEWAMWANEQAVASSSVSLLGMNIAVVLLLGSIVGISGMFHNWAFGVYGLIAALLVLVLEWPRGKRKKGTTMERHFQRCFTIIVNKLGVFGRNYFVRFVLYLILCVPCCFIIATLLGGICLLITSIIYFIAAIKGEEWKPTGLEDTGIDKKRLKSLHPPNKPPPRAPGAANNTNGATGSSVDVQGITVSVNETNETKKDTGSKKKWSKDNGNAADKKPPTRVPPRPKAAARDGIQDKK